MNPIVPLASAFYQATTSDLSPVECRATSLSKNPLRRPYECECDVDMFSQVWGSTALGFGGIGGQAMTSAYTVIVRGPMGDAAVYFNGRFAYHINHPNSLFHEHMSSRLMFPVSSCREYESDATKPKTNE